MELRILNEDATTRPDMFKCLHISQFSIFFFRVDDDILYDDKEYDSERR